MPVIMQNVLKYFLVRGFMILLYVEQILQGKEDNLHFEFVLIIAPSFQAIKNELRRPNTILFYFSKRYFSG